jgi:predicted esterase
MMAQPSRFTEQIAFKIDPEHPDQAAARIAEVMQDRVAECAYAVAAAFDHVISSHAEWAKLPRVAVGMSGGAMTLPSVVALEPDKYAAAVLVAGGADFLSIAIESNYRHLVEAMSFDWPSPPTPAQVEQLDRSYREKASLDSLHTSAVLLGKPVLMIHGTHDGAVPAHLGDELWEALGKPERWSEEAGHEEIFMRLPQKAGRICDWLAEKTAAKKTP